MVDVTQSAQFFVDTILPIVGAFGQILFIIYFAINLARNLHSIHNAIWPIIAILVLLFLVPIAEGLGNLLAPVNENLRYLGPLFDKLFLSPQDILRTS